MLQEAGQYLQTQPFGMAIVTAGTGTTGDSDKSLALSEARSFVIRKYLVKKFPMDDQRLKTLGLGKDVNGPADGAVKILVYPNGHKKETGNN